MKKKTFRELRQLAAEHEARRLGEQYDVVIVQRRDDRSVSTIHTTPAIFEVSELKRHEREKNSAAARGISADKIPIPVALLDFSAWTYHASCPKCSGRRLSIGGKYVDGRLFDDVLFAQENKSAPAACLRPETPARGDRDRNCGWKGKARELAYQCFTCGERSASASDGMCKGCRPKKTTPG